MGDGTADRVIRPTQDSCGNHLKRIVTCRCRDQRRRARARHLVPDQPPYGRGPARPGRVNAMGRSSGDGAASDRHQPASRITREGAADGAVTRNVSGARWSVTRDAAPDVQQGPAARGGAGRRRNSRGVPGSLRRRLSHLPEHVRPAALLRLPAPERVPRRRPDGRAQPDGRPRHVEPMALRHPRQHQQHARAVHPSRPA